MTQKEMRQTAKRLAKVYRCVGSQRIDPEEKSKLYTLAAIHPELHHLARKINSKRRKKVKR